MFNPSHWARAAPHFDAARVAVGLEAVHRLLARAVVLGSLGPGKGDQLFDVSLVGLPDHAIQLEPRVSSRAAIRGQRHRGGGGTGQRGAVAADFGAGRLERLQTLGHRVGFQMKVGVVDVGESRREPHTPTARRHR